MLRMQGDTGRRGRASRSQTQRCRAVRDSFPIPSKAPGRNPAISASNSSFTASFSPIGKRSSRLMWGSHPFCGFSFWSYPQLYTWMNAKPFWIYKGNLEEQFQSYREQAEEKHFIWLRQTETEPTMLLPAIHFYGLLLACTFTRSYSAFKNDATEILYSHVVKPAPASPSSNSTLNQARNGGRHYAGTGSDRHSEYPTGRPSTAAFGPRPRSPPSAAPRGAGRGKMLLPVALLRLAPEHAGPCKSCRTGSLGQVASWGKFSQIWWVIRQGRKIKGKEREALPKRSLS